MSDLISRQAAIDTHCELCGDRWCCNGDICPDVEVFKLLPSVQPDNDMIHLQKEQAYLQGWEEGREALRKEMWEDGRDRLD